MLHLLFGASGRLFVKTGHLLRLHSRPGSHKAEAAGIPSLR